MEMNTAKVLVTVNVPTTFELPKHIVYGIQLLNDHLTSKGLRKVNSIRFLRTAYPDMGLKEAKNIVECIAENLPLAA